jgi:pilus assembly protein CpaB
MSRITPGTLIIAILAVLFGLVGAYAVRSYLTPPPTPTVAAPKPEVPITVPVAATDLEAGRPLTNSDIGILRLTAKEIIDRKIVENFMNRPTDIEGRILKEPLKAGQPFYARLFYPEGGEPDVSDKLADGHRAVTINVAGIGPKNRLIVPGTIVDVLFRTLPGATRLPPSTVMLVQSAKVLAVGENIVPGFRTANPTTTPLGQAQQNDTTSVTLEVTLEEANRIKVVEGKGELSIVLRGKSDAEPIQNVIYPQTLDQLLGIPPKPAPFTANIYRRNSVQKLTFDGNEVIDNQFTPLQITPSRRATAPTTPNPNAVPATPNPAPQQQTPPTPPATNNNGVPGDQRSNFPGLIDRNFFSQTP